MLIYLVLGIIIGGVGVGWWMKRKLKSNLSVPAGHLPSPGEMGEVINPEQVEKRKENLEKVLEIARQKGEIANDDVERGLGISNATAERYLQELETQGKLVQVGSTGRNVIYKPK